MGGPHFLLPLKPPVSRLAWVISMWGNRAVNRSATSLPRGAPPEPTTSSDDRSCFATKSDFTITMISDGKTGMNVTRYLSTTCSMAAKSNRSISTDVSPSAVIRSSIVNPKTWNRGTVNRITGGLCGSSWVFL
ncbi:hypothetical protein Taro_018267 [Colocasia esculenta]|uniref:Uncharacterized protein n=1 Tax=Colocasia esculenta TaxID=4460 RepID=A0A843UIB9_COLES|nr:hypothetical protein [Colocasia esculenta]